VLALATTTAHVKGRPTVETPRPRDSHGALLPETPATRGPFDAHRAPFSARVRGASRGGAGADDQVHLQTWYLDPSAWPVFKGDTIVDDNDDTTWRVEASDLVPTGLGLEQVMAACSQLDTQAS
jgi:hypothetical protein